MSDANPPAAIEIRALVLPSDPPGATPMDLTVEAGETVGLLGDDQVRLTQIIRVVGGLERPASGTVKVFGVDVGAASRQTLLQLRRTIGYVSVAGGLLSNMTVRDNVALALHYFQDEDGRGPDSVTERCNELIALGSLEDVADQPASVVPAEYQKCAAYVRALGRNPKLLLVEDPAAFLHPDGRSTIARLHAKVRGTGITILLADDDVGLAQRLVERALWLTGDTISYDGPSATLPRELAPSGRTMLPFDIR